MIIYILRKAFNLIFVPSLIILLIIALYENNHTLHKEDVDDNKRGDCWEDYVKNMFTIVSCVMFIVMLVVLWIKRKLLFLLMLLSVPSFLEKLNNLFDSVSVVGDVVKYKKDGATSLRERLSIIIVGNVVYFLQVLKTFEKCCDLILKLDNTMLADMLMIMIYILTIFLYLFLILSLFPIPLISIIKLFNAIMKKMPVKERIKEIGDYFVNKIDAPLIQSNLLVVLVKKLGNNKGVRRILCCFLVPIVLIFELIFPMIMLVGSMVTSTIGYLVLLLKRIKKATIKIYEWILSLSSRKYIAIVFRVALIAALTITVVINRYQQILENYQEGTEVLEFVASTIIIPILFEWINSYSNEKRRQAVL